MQIISQLSVGRSTGNRIHVDCKQTAYRYLHLGVSMSQNNIRQCLRPVFEKENLNQQKNLVLVAFLRTGTVFLSKFMLTHIEFR